MALSNLVVTDITAPESVKNGQTISLFWTVGNQGEEPTTSSYWFDRLVYSTDEIFGNEDDLYFTDVYTPSYANLPLDANGNYTINASITVPNYATGQGFLLVKTDVYDNQIETDETDNVKSVTLNVLPPQANLVVTNITAPESAKNGQIISLSWTVENQGEEPTTFSYWFDSIVYSTDEIFGNGDDVELNVYAPDYLSLPLDANGNYIINANITIPNYITGQGFLLVKTDIYNYQIETDETDNVKSVAINITAPLDNLVVTDITAPATATSGETISLSWTVENQGEEATTFSYWYDSIVYSTDEIFGNGDDVYLTNVYTPYYASLPLDANGNYTINISITLPYYLTGEGYLLVKTDVYDNQIETDETDNVKSVAISVIPPDINLVVTDIVAPSLVGSGQYTSLSWTVKNQGTLSTTANYWYDRIVYSTDDVFGNSDDVYLNEVSAYWWNANLPLDPNETYTLSTDVYLPSNLAGSGYLFVKIDQYNDQIETDETDNVYSVPITITNPNLVVTNITAPTSANIGQAISISWTVENQGTVPTVRDSWYDRIFYSTDDIFGNSDDVYITEVYAYWWNANLPLYPNETYTLTTDVYLPSNNLAGSGYLFVKTDQYNYETETDETDNVYSVPITLSGANLVVTNVTAPTSAITGQTVSLSWTVQNQGDAATTAGSWYDRVVFSQDTIFGNNDDIYLRENWIASYANLPLDPNETYTVTQNIALANNIAGSGYLLFKTDNYNYKTETNEQDNVYSLAIDVTAPNLVISNPTPPPISAVVGETIAVSWQVTNTGTVSANADWYDAVYLSDDDIFDSSDIYLTDIWTGSNTPLAANASYTINRNITLPTSSGIGNRYLLFIADYYSNYQGETNETDNVVATPITLNAPDLVVTAATAPATLTIGQTANLSWTVSNTGNSTAPSDWFDRVYISDDTTFDSSDTLLTSQSAAASTPLAVGNSYTLSATNVAVPLTNTGDRYLLFVADATSNQGETNEANNVLSLPVTIVGSLPGARSATVSGDVFLGGNYIELGLSRWGSFGTNAAKPSDFYGTNVRSQIGMSADFDGFRNGQDLRFDYFLPGSPEERWVIGYQAGGSTFTASNSARNGPTQITNSVTNTSTGDQLSAVSTGGYNNTLGITQQIGFRVDDKYFRNIVTLTNISAQTLNSVRYMRSVDPDNTVDLGGDYTTDNIVQATIAADGRAIVEARTAYDNDPVFQKTGSRAPIFFYSNDPRAVASTFGFTNTNPYDSLAYTTPAARGQTIRDDQAITLTFDVGTLLPGEAATFVYYTSLDERNFEDVIAELERPDLTVTSATPSASSAQFGSSLDISWVIANNGLREATGGWTDRIYLSSDATLSGDDLLLISLPTGDTTVLPNGSISRTTSLNLPFDDNSTAGSYYLLVQADALGNQQESVETNNVRAAAIELTLPPLPDLVISDATAPATLILGQTGTVAWTVTNQGAGVATKDWSDRVYLSFDNILDASDILLLTEAIASQTPLNPSANYTISRNFTPATTLAAGAYNLLIVTDSDRQQRETDDTNNLRIVPITITAPDLVVSSITAPVEAISGQQIEIAWTITNQGAADATGTWTDNVYLSNDGTIGSDLYINSFTFTGTIAAGATIERRQLITVPIELSGNYRVVISTDAYNQLLEGTANEANNTSIDDNSTQIRLSPFPNLQVSSVIAPPTAFSSQETVVQWTVTNNGTGATSAPFWYDHVWLSLDNTLDNTDTYLGSATNVSYLNVGESYSNSLTVKLPRGIDNNYYFIVKTDANNNVFEFQNEADNVGVGGPTDVDLTPPPDFRVTAVNAPTQGFSGQPLTLTWTVTNEGTGSNLETSWYDEVFMSVDDLLDAGDRSLGRFYRSGTINPGTSYDVTQTVNLPIGVSGDFFFFVRTDAGNQVYENVFESNNTGYDTTATKINLTPPPDLEVEFVDAPATASASRPLTISYRVTNFGATATPNSSWTDSFYLSTDTQLDPNTDLKLGERTRFGTLDIGASYDNSATFILPNTLTGTYYAFVVTDSGNTVFEINNSNNIVFDSTAINISSQPADLVVSASAPTTAEAGKAVLVEWTVTNQGIGDTAVTNWTDRIVASIDAVLGNGDDVVLANFDRNGLLNPGGLYSRQELVTIPFNLVGDYNLFVVTDANNSVYEATNEGNNSTVQSLSITRQTPDLQVTGVSIPSTALSGQGLTVNWTVKNFGSGKTNVDYWYDDVYLSTDAVISGNDIFLGRVYRSGVLEASAEYSVTRSFNLPISLQGEFYTIVRTDAAVPGYGDRVLETPFENNNDLASSGTTNIALSPVPDLVVASVDAASTGLSGQLLNVTWTVQNNGAANTGNSSWYDAFYLSRDQFFDRNSDTYIGFKARTQDLAAGASYTDTASFRIPQGLSGPFYVFAVADSGNNINELSGEQNNIGYDGNSTEISLAQPADLVVSAITIPVNGVPGQNATISYTVTNQGANASVGSWSDAIYISADNQWDVNDVLFGKVQHFGDVASGGSYSETLTAALPGVLPGDYYVIIRSDIRNQIPESNESNNTQVSLTQVSLNPEELQLDIADIDTLAQGQSVFYRVDVAAGESLVINFDSASATAFNELYVSFGEVPTRADFDFAGITPFMADQRVVVPTTQAGTYFIRAFGNNVPSSPASYSITAEIAEFSVFDQNYGRGGNAGNLTIEINGVKFDRTVTARLTDGTGFNRQAVKVYPIDQTKAFATFDLRGLAPGNYDVIIENADGESITVNDGLEVVAGGGGNNRPTIDAPTSIRRNSSFNFTASWGNDGLNDAVVPLLQVGNDSVPFGVKPGDLSAGNQTIFLGTVAEGPAGILRPGQGVSIPFFSISGNTAGTYQVSVDRQFNDLDAPFDFNAIRNSLIPAGLTEAEFQPIFDQFIAQIGSTQGDYLEALARNATLLPPELGNNRSEDDLLELELRKAIAAVGTSISGNIFARSFEVDISGVEVRAENTTTGKAFTTITLNDGSFIFEDLTPGVYTFTVASALIQGNLPPVELTAGEAVTGLTINLKPGAKISGEVTSAVNGQSLANASVYLFSNGELIDVAATDAQGKYVFQTVASGTYTLLIEAANLARTWASDVVVGENQAVVDVDVSLVDDAAITGSVSLADNQPTQNILVIASLESDNPSPIFSQLSENGNFSLGSLAAGVYDITIYQTGYVPVTFENVNIAAGANLNLGAITLEVDNGTAPQPENNARTLALASADSPIAAFLNPVDFFVPNELRLLKAAAELGVYGIIAWYNLGPEVRAIAEQYFNSFGANPTVPISPNGFRMSENAVTKSALEHITNTFANAIAQQLDKFPNVKAALENFDCDQGDQRIPLGNVQQLRQLLGLDSTLLFVDNDSPEVEKDRWKYSGVSNIPGFLAGGVGKGGPPPFIPPVPTILDSRGVSGNLTLLISRSGSVKLEADLNVEIQDTFDFFPGGLGDNIVIAAGVIGLGILETFSLAFDVPFHTSFQEQLKVPTSLSVTPSDDCCDDDCDNDDEDDINVPASYDPNDILGPQGFGEERWVTATSPLAYTIRFENDPVFATAPAQTVRITQQLDSDLDFRTFRVGDFGFGEIFVDVPDNRAFYQTRLDLTATLGIFVDVVAGIDTTTGEAFWEFTSIDPATGEIPADPLRGFLRPNLTPPEGDGFVNYTIRPKSTVTTGTVIDAQARIVFDINEPIDTPPIFNTIDADRPSSTVNALPSTTEAGEFLVSWSGSDDSNGSALANYTIYVSDNGSPFTPWLENTTLTEATYIGEPGHTYAFYSVARDNAGNSQPVPTTAQAIIQVLSSNVPPVLAQNQGLTVNEQNTIAIANTQLQVTDVDNSTAQVIYTLTDIPDNGVLSRNNVALAINDTFTQADIDSNLLSYTHNGSETTSDSFSFTVSDGNGGTIANTTFSITVNPVNDNPILVSAIADVTATEDTAFSFTIPANTFSDVDAGDTLTYTATLDNGNALPTWLSFDAATRTFSGTPANADVGTVNIKVTATDNSGASVDDIFTLTVANTNDAPTLGSAIADQNATEGTAFSFTIPANSFTDVDAGDILTYTTRLDNGNALPSWLSFNTTTRTFSGTPINNSAGNLNITVIATDNSGATASDTFLLTIGRNITGTSSNDTINGTDGNDILDGGAGSDRLVGGRGNDTYIVDSIRDVVVELSGEGIDTVQSAVTHTLTANVENLILTGTGNINGTGNELDNSITGNSGNNLLKGLGGNDTLIGGDGNDTLVGGAGNDTLIGGNGADTFLFGSGATFTSSAFGVDTITNFSQEVDKIVLSKTSFTALNSAVNSNLQASEFATMNETLANELSIAGVSSAKIIYNQSTGNLLYNPNGATAGLGSGGIFANLTATLTANDFLVQS